VGTTRAAGLGVVDSLCRGSTLLWALWVVKSQGRLYIEKTFPDRQPPPTHVYASS